MDKTSITEIAAWWGAIIASVVLLWDIYKWSQAGPKIRVSAKANMTPLETIGLSEAKKYVFVEATNVGDQATTLTHFLGYVYRSTFQRLRGKSEKEFIGVLTLPSGLKSLMY